MFLKPGERVKAEDLLKGIAVVSGNDACVALAEHLAGTEEAFVSKMNEKARELGLKDSQFRNSHGMPARDQWTTAFDIAVLADTISQTTRRRWPFTLSLNLNTTGSGSRTGTRC